MGVTACTGDPVMCVVIIDGEKRNPIVEIGVDLDFIKNDDDGVINLDHLISQKDKFPRGPTCIYQGKKINCMVRWNKGGGMNATMLTDVVRTIDQIRLFHKAKKWNKTIPITSND